MQRYGRSPISPSLRPWLPTYLGDPRPLRVDLVRDGRVGGVADLGFLGPAYVVAGDGNLLRPDHDVAVGDELPRLLRRTGEALPVHDGLEPALQLLLHLEGEDGLDTGIRADEPHPLQVIEHLPLLRFHDLRVHPGRGEGGDVPCGTPEPAEDHLGLPDLPLVPETVGDEEFDLVGLALLLELAGRFLVLLAVLTRVSHSFPSFTPSSSSRRRWSRCGPWTSSADHGPSGRSRAGYPGSSGSY